MSTDSFNSKLDKVLLQFVAEPELAINEDWYIEGKQSLIDLIKSEAKEHEPDFSKMDSYNRSFLQAMFNGFEKQLFDSLDGSDKR